MNVTLRRSMCRKCPISIEGGIRGGWAWGLLESSAVWFLDWITGLVGWAGLPTHASSSRTQPATELPGGIWDSQLQASLVGTNKGSHTFEKCPLFFLSTRNSGFSVTWEFSFSIVSPELCWSWDRSIVERHPLGMWNDSCPSMALLNNILRKLRELIWVKHSFLFSYVCCFLQTDSRKDCILSNSSIWNWNRVESLEFCVSSGWKNKKTLWSIWICVWLYFQLASFHSHRPR